LQAGASENLGFAAPLRLRELAAAVRLEYPEDGFGMVLAENNHGLDVTLCAGDEGQRAELGAEPGMVRRGSEELAAVGINDAVPAA
jgi:hypothetical protein